MISIIAPIPEGENQEIVHELLSIPLNDFAYA
jgi:hypothetical protein